MEYNQIDNGLLPTVSDVTDNYRTGYIKIFRALKTHWIWSDDKKLKWWLDILLSVNYSDQKVLIKGQLIECKRGQSIQSLETWAKSWRTTKKTVQTFFRLLEKDAMLTVENVKITTRITVCNFEGYNGLVNADDHAQETQSKRRLPPNNKDNKDNKDNNPKGLLVENEFSPEQNKQFEHFTKWIATHTPEVNKLPRKITLKEFLTLTGKVKNSSGTFLSISVQEIKEILEKIENNRKYLKTYRSPYLCILHWTKNNRTKQNS